MCGGMEDHIWMILLHDTRDPVRISAGADERHEIELRMLHQKLLLDAVGIVLIDIEDDELLRGMTCDLAAELGTDGATASCHENGLALNHVEDFVVIDLDWFPPEEVEDIDIAELADADLAIHELVDAWNGFQLAARFLTDVEDLGALFCAGRRNRIDNFCHFILLHSIEDVMARADDGDAIEHTALLIGIIVDEADGITL